MKEQESKHNMLSLTRLNTNLTYTEIILEGLAKKPTEELVEKLEAESQMGETRWKGYYSLTLESRIKEWPEDKVLKTLHEEYGRNGETAFADLLDRDLIRRWRESNEDSEWAEADSNAVPYMEGKSE